MVFKRLSILKLLQQKKVGKAAVSCSIPVLKTELSTWYEDSHYTFGLKAYTQSATPVDQMERKINDSA